MSQGLDSLSQEKRLFPPPKELSARAWVKDLAAYNKLYEDSIKEPEKFWTERANNYFWFKKWDRVLKFDWKESYKVEWFGGAKTNLTINALDRHLEKNGDRLATLWIGNEPGEEKKISYRELHEAVCRFANVLKSHGAKKGDRVAIYLPMIPELPVAMLACARIGAIHSVVFGGFSADSLAERILDSQCRFLITSDGGFRGNKKIPLKGIADEALRLCESKKLSLEKCFVVRRTKDPVPMQNGRDLWWDQEVASASPNCPAEEMDAEDPLFILYTSGSTGKPKGAVHSTAGYMVYATETFRTIFDYHPEDLYWCTADIGWITGHTYILYGPLCAGASSVLFEGIPTYPDPGRLWEIVQKHHVNILYTAPTAIRSLMREGDQWPAKYNLSSLKILGSVGEPINPEAWIWYHEKIGHGHCPIVDTWWQTETGGILITPLPGAMPTKPGSASLPFFGIEPAILKEDGTECKTNEGGLLVIKKPWPGIMRTVYGQHDRFIQTYFTQFPGRYFTGDSARRDEDRYFWLMGRIDDVIKVSGHRIGTAEVESSLVSHPSVAEAAVVAIPHEIKGQGIYAFVSLREGFQPTEPLNKELVQHVRKEIGAIATPERIQFAPSLPKTRSGKIMRRILRKIAEGKPEEIGDATTLADPSVVHQLLSGC